MDFAFATGLCFDGQFKVLMNIVHAYVNDANDKEKYLKIRQTVESLPFPSCTRAFHLLRGILSGVDDLIRIYHRWHFNDGRYYLQRMVNDIIACAGSNIRYWVVVNAVQD